LLMTVFVASTNTFGEVKRIPRYNKLTHTWNSYPLVTIHDITYVPPDSLHLADSLQNSIPLRWTSQLGSYYGDTVVIVGVVYAPYFTITYTQHGWTMMLLDTVNTGAGWSGTMVRVGGAPDTSIADGDGFKIPARGDVVMMTVHVEDFPTSSFNTGPQVAPVSGINIDIVGSMAIPAPQSVRISDIYQHAYPGGSVNYTGAKQWENVPIKISNLRVVSIVNAARGTWSMVDSLGNAISDYDESYNWSFTSSETPPTKPDTSVTHFHTPIVGQKIDSIKGYLSVASGQENVRGFRICPIYPGDVSFGAIYPSIFSGRRTPVVPTPTDSVSVTVKVNKPLGGNPIAAVTLYKSINNGAWQGVPMSMITLDSTYQAYIFDQDGNPYAANTFVRYYMAAVDDHGLVQLLANPTSQNSADTTKGYFFYTVTNGGSPSIYNIQYTPYSTGVSPYNGAVVTVGGIVTADSTDLLLTPINGSSGGTNAWYIQSGVGPWNGIWLVSKDTITKAALSTLHHGDSIIVTGTVDENFSVTEIIDSMFTVVSHNNPIPAPTKITTATFGFKGDGDLTAEPYEGVLVRLKNATVTDVYPTFSDASEYEITDSTGTPMLVRRDGRNSYTNEVGDTTLGYTRVMNVGDKIDTLTGVGFYSFSRYKITPRTNADYVNVGLPLQYATGWNMVSTYRKQVPDSTGYNVSTLYPGRTSNVFGYNGSGYIIVQNTALGKGYWMKFGAPKTIRQTGIVVSSDTIPIFAGWNMIGCTGLSVSTSSIVSFPSNNIISKYFGYSGGYTTKTTLTPPNGYWVKAAGTGYIVENGGSVLLPKTSSPNLLENYNSVTLSDSKGNSQTLYFIQDAKGVVKVDEFAMPPAGPSGFDARFSSGRMVETYSGKSKTGEQFPIQLQGSGSITVSWNIIESNHNTIVLADSKANGASFEMKGTGTQKNVKLTSNTLVLKIGASNLVPRVFSLSQNYPNPFNPTTRMQIGVPEASHVTVKVYDILGQLVKTLVNDDRPEGYQTIVWDGSSDAGRTVASGVYFVRMEAEKFVQIQKVVMMK